MALEARETKVVEIVVDHEISPEHITALIIQAGGLFGGRGCRTCGLVGVDLRLTGQDPDADRPSGALSMVIS
jgi:hypothetical protein